jgi:ankyrin repeat protein
MGTSLMVAAWGCKMEVAKTLLSGGALVNAANTKGETALMYASQTCRDGQMVKMLLEAGANPNAKGEKNFTALMGASGNPLNAEELLRAGADPTVKNEYGNTAESDNCDRGDADHSQVCSLIRDALKQSVGRSQDR